MNALAKLTDKNHPVFLTDAGLETWLVFHRGIELRDFAAFELIHSEAGKAALVEYWTEFLALAQSQNRGFILDTPTWRASPDWCQKLGFDLHEMEEINRDATAFMRRFKEKSPINAPLVINGIIGPRGDGYVPGRLMSIAAARAYHSAQITALAKAGVDMISALTMNNVAEAVGIAMAAKNENIPCVISFTVETDGRLPTEQSLADAIHEVDAATDNYPLYFMVNCAHPDHFRDAVREDAKWLQRICGIRANASRMSHAELDKAEELDEGNPQELGSLHKELFRLLPNIRALGGCCGTDHRHVACIANHIPRYQHT
ncbi:homocysteine S-methyltransferase family protein [Pararhizobium sp. IMCC21322]|uniref:homocysteine S-methyltransferase family protein n=1 Tax=Pararhizobium sp. IMCC21322 TaxID=3067903 RepID=UPI00274111AA|nr:homocysteine S-methyltransferase family protein [Pararhizobium sp. IMCC21322]